MGVHICGKRALTLAECTECGALESDVNQLKEDVKNAKGDIKEIREIISNLDAVQIVAVDALPETGENGTIYLVPREGTTDRDEYLWINNDWELIGSTGINLDDYQKKLTAGDGITIDSNNVISSTASTGTVEDVKIDGTSVVTNKVANIPLNDKTLTIQKNGTTVQTFTANSASDKTANITVPTKTSELTNDSDFVEASDLATVATSGSYTDLTSKPTINDKTLTIQKNGTNVQTFTANSATDKTANITVPTKTSELTNDSNYVKSNDLATVATSGSYNDLTDKPSASTVNDGTLTIQKNGSTVQTFTANSATNKTANIEVPTVNDATLTIQKNGTNVQTFSANSSTNKTANIEVPTVNNATLTIQKNGTNVQTFTANASANKTANIEVPTKTSEITNDSKFVTTTTLNDAFIVQEPFGISDISISAGSYSNGTATTTKTGYTPIGIAGYQIQGANRTYVQIPTLYLNRTTVGTNPNGAEVIYTVSARTTSMNFSGTLWIRILWQKVL